MRMRVSGSDESGSQYFSQQIAANGTTLTGFRQSSGTSWIEVIYLQSAFQNQSPILVSNPFPTRVTNIQNWGGTQINGSSISQTIWYRGLNTATSYTGFSIIIGSGTITGSVSVYGYNK